MSTEEGLQLGAVTLLDVLGWKGIWQREARATEVIKRLRDLIDAAQARSQSLLASDPRFTTLRGIQSQIECISDTIVLLTHGNPQETIELHGEISRTLICDSIERRIPLRGATSYGRFQADEKGRIFVGPAIDEAASWHENVSWIGCIQTPSAYLNYLETPSGPWKIYSKIPCKDRAISEGNCANWASEWISSGNSEDKLRKLFFEMGPLIPPVGKIYIESLNFFRSATGGSPA